MAKNVLVGFGRADITPTESVPLRGYGNTSKRMSGPVIDPQYTTCLAFSDGETTILLYTSDLTGNGNGCDTVLRPAVAEATGLPVNNIHMSASHNHSAADVDNLEIPSVARYNEYLKNQLVAAGKAALADLKEARIYVTDIETAGLNFVRRYVLEDGTYAGDNYGHFRESPIKCHESEADRKLQLVKFVREGCADVILANFQGHPHRLGGSHKPEITSDVVGAFRTEMEKRTGCLLAYATGASGNQNSHSRILSEMAAETWLDHGRILADYAEEAMKHFREVSAEGVGVTTLDLDMPINHSMDHLLEEAKKIHAAWLETNDHKYCSALGRPYGINSPYHAGAIVRRVDMPATFDVSIHAIRVGQIGIAVAPVEMFDTLGMMIKESSPFEMTVIATCCNTGKGYLPSKLGWAHGGYSCDTTRFSPGSGEELAGHFVDLLTKLHNA
jgi:hypothetical protein